MRNDIENRMVVPCADEEGYRERQTRAERRANRYRPYDDDAWWGTNPIIEAEIQRQADASQRNQTTRP